MAYQYTSLEHEIAVFDDIMITMRDGSRMCATIRFPAKDGRVDFSKKYPVYLHRTSYRMDQPTGDPSHPVANSKDSHNLGGEGFMQEFVTGDGYVFVNVAARGTYHSEGQLQPLANEGWGQDDSPDRGGWGVHKDGLDIIDWVLRQPWCNGQIATSGISWHGAAQLLPWLADNECGISSSFIMAPAVNTGRADWGYCNGFYTLGLQILWVFQTLQGQLETHRFAPAVAKKIMADMALLGGLPSSLAEMPAFINKAALEFPRKYGLLEMPVMRHVPYWRKWVENRDNKDFFTYNNTDGRKHAFNKPLAFYTGYNDVFTKNAVWAYEQAVKDAPTPEIADGHRLILSPYCHIHYRASDDPALMMSTRTDLVSMALAWHDRQLRGEPCEIFDKGHVILFVQGEEKWRTEPAWPIADTRFTEYYLHSGGSANTSSGDGLLSTEKPAAEPADHYVSDPMDPAPSIRDNQLMVGGYGDVSMAESRPDMLIYTTPVLEEDVEITGWVKATLYASTDATDSDFIMRLVDVYPDGKARHLTMGGCRGRYRKDRWNPEAMIPGQIEKLELPMHVTSCMFKAGHRIRVEVCSAAAPLWDINPNAFVDLNTCTEKDYVKANITICHDADHPSSITLPIIPASHQRDWVDQWPFDPDVTGGYYEGDFMLPNFNFEERIAGMTYTLLPESDLPRVD